MSNKFQVEVSARHIHLNQATLEVLFGKGYTLTNKRELSQPEQFVSEERVDIIGPKKTIENVVILGPIRPNTQVEVSLTDCYTLGQVAPVRESGNLVNTPSILLRGTKGELEIKNGLIIAKRHIHMTIEDAQARGVKNKQIVSVAVDTGRPLIFGDVVIRVSDSYACAMHIDTDEANAAFIGRAGCDGEIV